MVEVVHRSLSRRGLLPSEHLVDKSYTDAKVLVRSRAEHDVAIVGPMAQDPSWQTRESASFDKSTFVVDWEAKIVTCPAGKQSLSWLPNTYPANGTAFEARFARADCTPCASRRRCTHSRVEPRIVGLQDREHHEALQTMRAPEDAGVPARIRTVCRHREHPRLSHPAQWLAPRPLSRARQNSSSAHHHSHGDQPSAHRCVAGRRATDRHPLLPFRGPSVQLKVISPPVSLLGLPLIGNSIDAIRKEGRILLRERVAMHPKTGQHGIRITVADTGKGMSAEVTARLFEAFQSTKGLNGSGLGLWISKGIVEKHCGSIRFCSSTKPRSSGTVFSLFIPLDNPRSEQQF